MLLIWKQTNKKIMCRLQLQNTHCLCPDSCHKICSGQQSKAIINC